MYMTLVLVALALVARRAELLALRRDRQFIHLAEDWFFVLLYSDPSVLCKTSKGRHPTEPYKLRALPPGDPPRGNAMVV